MSAATAAGWPPPWVRERSVVVVGLGASGAAAAAALHAAGPPRSLRVVEARDDEDVRRRAADLPGARVDLGLDESEVVAAAAGADLVVPSPGVRAGHALLRHARDRGITVWSEPELAWQLCAGRATRLVGVTGTNGKTSVTELLAACLQAPAAGNIGQPLVEVVGGPTPPPPVVVAELSSFQLWFTEQLRPAVAVLLNVAADHLDWHGSAAAYAASKARIWANQRSGDVAVVNVDDPGAAALVRSHPPPAELQTVTVDEPSPGQVGVVDGWIVDRAGGHEQRLLAVADIGWAAHHHLGNAVAALSAARRAGAEPEAVAVALREFRPGRHRLEEVARTGGVRFVDDSKATNPHAAAAALATFDDVVWIAGGLGKGLAFDELAEVVGARVSLALTIGTSGPELAAMARAVGVETVEVGELASAVRLAARRARPGQVVLLAPACASMDQFPDYAARGAAFRAAVAELGDELAAERPDITEEAGRG